MTQSRLEVRLDDHAERIRALENDRAANQERHIAVLGAIDGIKTTIEKAIDEIKKNFVTKEALEVLVKDGKYRTLWGGLIGAMITTVVVSILAFFLT